MHRASYVQVRMLPTELLLLAPPKAQLRLKEWAGKPRHYRERKKKEREEKTSQSQDRAAVGLPLCVLPRRRSSRHLCRRPHVQLSSNHQCREAAAGRGAAHGPSDAEPKEVQRRRLRTQQWRWSRHQVGQGQAWVSTFVCEAKAETTPGYHRPPLHLLGTPDLLVTQVVPLHHLHLLVAPLVLRPPLLRTRINLHLLVAPVLRPPLRTGLRLPLLITPVALQPHHLVIRVVVVVVPLLRAGLRLPLPMVPLVLALHLHLLGTAGVLPRLRTGLHLPLLMTAVLVALHLHLLGTTGVLPWLRTGLHLPPLMALVALHLHLLITAPVLPWVRAGFSNPSMGLLLLWSRR